MRYQTPWFLKYFLGLWGNPWFEPVVSWFPAGSTFWGCGRNPWFEPVVSQFPAGSKHEHLAKECMITGQLFKKMDKSHQYHDTSKVMGSNHKHMQFTVLVWCTAKFETSNTSKRRGTELCWIFKLHSLAPIGINQFV